ncbi:MAG: 4-(cytidine 5'-diphospho)-2-C-methyl-D-erythritol kinase [Gaiellaceae bacterium]
MSRRNAHAKLNLALVVGRERSDGKHELLSVYQRLQLADRITLERADALRVDGFEPDTLVRGALEALAAESGARPGWRITIQKVIPVASGLGGGSSDAAVALLLANELLASPLAPVRLRRLAARIGADVPFFLCAGPQLGEGDGTELRPLALPQEYAVVLVLPAGPGKMSTASVYSQFDARRGYEGFAERRAAVLAALETVTAPEDLALLPGNDLARSPLADRLRTLGAFRADVSGAGPIVYGLFAEAKRAKAAADALKPGVRGVWVTAPAW